MSAFGSFFPRLALGSALTGALVAAGCASAAPKRSFTPVAGTVSARTGQTIVRRDDPDGGPAADPDITELLKRPLSADGAVRVALLNNPGLQAIYSEIGISRADFAEAGLLANPRITLWRQQGGGGLSRNGYSVVQDFLDLFTLHLRRKAAGAALEAAQARVTGEVLDLAGETRRAYFTALGTRHLLGLIRQAVAAERTALRIAQRQHDAGTLGDLELAQQQAAYDQLRLEQADLESELRAGRERLTRLMGLWGAQTEWEPPETLPELPEGEIPLENLEARAVDQRPELIARESEVTALSAALRLTRNFRFLTLLEVGYDVEKDPEGVRVAGPTVSLGLPLFNRGKARVARLKAELRAAEWRYRQAAVEIRSEVRESRDRMRAERGKVAYFDEVLLPDRRRLVDTTLLHYNAMLKGVYDLLLAKQNELSAERGRVAALRDYWIARADLEHAVGGRLTAAAPSGPAAPRQDAPS